MTAICIIGFLIFILASLIIYKISKKQENFLKSSLIALGAILIFSLGCELTLFNINFYATKGNTAIDLTPYIEHYKTEDGCYSFAGYDEIDFTELDVEIENIRIDLSDKNKGGTDVYIYLTDEANEYYYANPGRTVYHSVEKSEYINIHTAGKTDNLKIKFGDEEFISVNSISVNNERPFEFSVFRLLALAAILIFIYIFKPSSPLYKRNLAQSQNLKYNLTVAFVALQCVIIVFVGTMNPAFLGFDITDEGLTFSELVFRHHNQYDELAQAILQGKTYIDNNDVPQSLIDMDNPYDTVARSINSSITGDTYRWDVAYFNGHYYVYFGIVPLLIMYLPFRALFDAPFPSAVGIMVFAMIFALGVFKLLGLICEKHFKKISVGTYMLVTLAFVNCCGMMFLVKRPDFYSVPIMTALAFLIWGIYFWIKGRDETKRKNFYLFVGSLFCALSVGCRPQTVLVCALALPLFAGYFLKNKYILTKKGITNLIILAIPFVIVASGIMYYNYIRFGSPTDFGSSYNLTTNDVTRRGFDIGRTGLGIFTYLFQPPQFTAVFPYIKSVKIETNYIGKTIYELCFGGLITSLPVLWFIFGLPKASKALKKEKLFSLVLTTLAVGLALVIADTQAGGLLQRYYCDFGFIFFLAAALVIFALLNNENLKECNINLNSILFISTILSFVYTIALVFSSADVTIDTQNPTLYAKILHLFEFWI